MNAPWWKPVKQLGVAPDIQAEYERSIHSINAEAERRVWLSLVWFAIGAALAMRMAGLVWGWSLLFGGFVALFGGAFWILMNLTDRRS